MAKFIGWLVFDVLVCIALLYSMPLWGCLFLIFTTRHYWLGPILVRMAFKQDAEVIYEPFVLEDIESYPGARKFFESARTALEKEGFSEGERLWQKTQITNNRIALIGYKHELNLDDAFALVSLGEDAGEKTVTTRVIGFSTDFEDGSILEINNSADVLSFPNPLHRTLIQMPNIVDPAHLYHLHQAYRQRHYPTVCPKPWKYRSLKDCLAEEHRLQVAYWIQHHYAFVAAGDRVLRLTWKGAFWGGIRLSSPVRAILKQQVLERATELQMNLLAA